MIETEAMGTTTMASFTKRVISGDGERLAARNRATR
jgi:hypothetical protein